MIRKNNPFEIRIPSILFEIW